MNNDFKKIPKCAKREKDVPKGTKKTVLRSCGAAVLQSKNGAAINNSAAVLKCCGAAVREERGKRGEARVRSKK